VDYVNRLARLTPSLERQPAYEAELPMVRLADSLQFSGRFNDIIHVPLPF
jgi:hypothetical protein